MSGVPRGSLAVLAAIVVVLSSTTAPVLGAANTSEAETAANASDLTSSVSEKSDTANRAGKPIVNSQERRAGSMASPERQADKYPFVQYTVIDEKQGVKYELPPGEHPREAGLPGGSYLVIKETIYRNRTETSRFRITISAAGKIADRGAIETETHSADIQLRAAVGIESWEGSYASNDTVRIWVGAVNTTGALETPVSGANLSVEISGSNGSIKTINKTTNKTGAASVSFSLGGRPEGEYDVRVTSAITPDNGHTDFYSGNYVRVYPEFHEQAEQGRMVTLGVRVTQAGRPQSNVTETIEIHRPDGSSMTQNVTVDANGSATISFTPHLVGGYWIESARSPTDGANIEVGNLLGTLRANGDEYWADVFPGQTVHISGYLVNGSTPLRNQTIIVSVLNTTDYSNQFVETNLTTQTGPNGQFITQWVTPNRANLDFEVRVMTPSGDRLQMGPDVSVDQRRTGGGGPSPGPSGPRISIDSELLTPTYEDIVAPGTNATTWLRVEVNGSPVSGQIVEYRLKLDWDGPIVASGTVVTNSSGEALIQAPVPDGTNGSDLRLRTAVTVKNVTETETEYGDIRPYRYDDHWYIGPDRNAIYEFEATDARTGTAVAGLPVTITGEYENLFHGSVFGAAAAETNENGSATLSIQVPPDATRDLNLGPTYPYFDGGFPHLDIESYPARINGIDQYEYEAGQTITFNYTVDTPSDVTGILVMRTWDEENVAEPILVGQRVAPGEEINVTLPSVTKDTSYSIDIWTVNDSGLTTRADEYIRVNGSGNGTNGAPIADAGGNRTTASGHTVTLDAGGSSDPDGDVLSYTWSQVSGPSVNLTDANTATPEFVAPNVSSERTLTFEVTVSDGLETDTDTVAVTVLPAEAPQTVVLNRTFGGSGFDEALSLIETSDGGLAFAGWTDSFGNDSDDAWVVKLGPSGAVEMNRTFGGSDLDQAWSLIETSDGGLAFAGRTDSFGNGSSDAWVVKLDPSGTVEMNRTFGGSGFDHAWSLVETSDGDLAFAGISDSFANGSSDAWVVKLGPSGAVEMNRTFGGSGSEEAISLTETSDGGLAFAGRTDSFGNGSDDAWVVKLDPSGTVEMNRTFGGNYTDVAGSLIETSDGDFAFAGWTEPSKRGSSDAWVVKLDPSGTVELNRTFGGSDFDAALPLVETSDGGLAFAGVSESFGNRSWDAWVVDIGPSGTVEINRTLGGNANDYALTLVETSDGGLAFAGLTESFGNGPGDAWVVKLGSRKAVAPSLQVGFETDLNRTGVISNDQAWEQWGGPCCSGSFDKRLFTWDEVKAGDPGSLPTDTMESTDFTQSYHDEVGGNFMIQQSGGFGNFFSSFAFSNYSSNYPAAPYRPSEVRLRVGGNDHESGFSAQGGVELRDDSGNTFIRFGFQTNDGSGPFTVNGMTVESDRNNGLYDVILTNIDWTRGTFDIEVYRQTQTGYESSPIFSKTGMAFRNNATANIDVVWMHAESSIQVYIDELTIGARAEGGNFVDVTGVDPSEFPRVRTFANVNTTAGREGRLTAADFTVIENGTRQPIEAVNFTSTNTTNASKVDIAVVFDRTGSMGDEIDTMRRGVRNMSQRLSASGRDVRFALVSFSDDDERLQPVGQNWAYRQNFTDNVTRFETALAALNASGGIENNYDALGGALELGFRPDAQKVIIDITDEDNDNASVSQSQIAQRLQEQGITYIAVSPEFTHSSVSALARDDAQTTVTDESAGEQPVRSAATRDTDKRVLAQTVSGQWHNIGDVDFSTILTNITTSLSTTYIIEYNTTDPAYDGTTRDVVVRVSDPQAGTSSDSGAYIAPTAGRLEVTGINAPGRVSVTDSLAVSATVRNTGDRAVTQTVAVRLDTDGDGVLEANETLATRDVTLRADASTTLSFATPLNNVAAGSYTLGVVTANATRTARVDVSVESFTCGPSTGDPHLITFDGVAYDFQAAGEFVLVREIGGPLEVQARQVPLPSRPSVTINTAGATMVDGHEVMVDARDPTPLYIDGSPRTLADGASVSVGNGSVVRQGNTYTIVYPGSNNRTDPSDEHLTIDLYGDRLDLKVCLDESRSTPVEGLLGSPDGNASNDLAFDNGTTIDQPPAFDVLYGAFRADWLVNSTTTLFTYDSGESPSHFFQPGIPSESVTVEDLPSNLRQDARQAAIDAGLEPGTPSFRNAVLDYALTNRTDYLASAQQAAAVSTSLKATRFDAKWRVSLEAPNTRMIVTDTDGDGIDEIGISNHEAWGPTPVWGLLKEGAWVWNKSSSGEISANRAGDVDGDGDAELIVGGRSGLNWVRPYDHNGSYRWHADFPHLPGHSVADFDRDGKDEVLAIGIIPGNLFAWDDDGTLLLDATNQSLMNHVSDALNVTGDRSPEFIVKTRSDRLALVRKDNMSHVSQIWIAGPSSISEAAFTDLSGDSSADVLAAYADNGEVRALDVSDGSTIWSIDTGLSGNSAELLERTGSTPLAVLWNGQNLSVVDSSTRTTANFSLDARITGVYEFEDSRFIVQTTDYIGVLDPATGVISRFRVNRSIQAIDAGDVDGDSATEVVVAYSAEVVAYDTVGGAACSPLAPGLSAPTDPDGDGEFEDLNGNGRFDFNDLVTFFDNMSSASVDCHDFNDNGRIDFDDIVTLFEEI